MGIEVTKEEQEKLNNLFRQIERREAFIAQQQEAAEKLRCLKDEPAVPVWVVVNDYTLRDWGQPGIDVDGVYLSLDEAVNRIHKLRDKHKGEGTLLPIEGDGENTEWRYCSWDEDNHYSIKESEIKSTIKEDEK